MNSTLRLDKKWYNPLFFILNEIRKVHTIRRVLVYGGKSSSKTVSIAQMLSKEAVRCNASSIAFRKENSIIPTTLKKTFNLALSTQYIGPAFEVQDRKYIAEGAEIVLKGLDEEEKAKGIESYKYLFIDELNQFEYSEFLQFDMSLRGIEGQQIYAAWNPVSETSWVKTDLIDKEEWLDYEPYKLPNPESFVRISADGSTALIKTNYEDNYWIVGADGYGYRDENLIKLYNNLREKDSEAYRVNVKGEWGVIKPGDPYVYAFDINKHVGSTTVSNHHELYLSFDFNISPISCGVFQHYGGKIYGIESLKLDNSDIYKMCDYIKIKYPGFMYIVTGDATGRASSALVKDGINYYTVIKEKLNLSIGQLKVPSVNPNVEENRMLVNAVFHSGVIVLDRDKCGPLIFDCQYVAVTETGSIDKGSRTDPKKRSDFLDGARYYFTTFHRNLLRL